MGSFGGSMGFCTTKYYECKCNGSDEELKISYKQCATFPGEKKLSNIFDRQIDVFSLPHV